jgi:N-acyl-D-aspartate/D-glutamate deacylase
MANLGLTVFTSSDYLRHKGTSMTDSQKVWEALRAIYGMDLTAATLVVLTKDGETAVKFQTIYFPQEDKHD